MDQRVDYIAKVLADLIKLAQQDRDRTAMLVYLLTMALAEVDDLKRGANRNGD